MCYGWCVSGGKEIEEMNDALSGTLLHCLEIVPACKYMYQVNCLHAPYRATLHRFGKICLIYVRS